MQEASSFLFSGIRFRPLCSIHTYSAYRWTHSLNDQHRECTRPRLKKKIGRITAFFFPYFTLSGSAFNSSLTFTTLQRSSTSLRVGHMSMSIIM